MTQEEKSMFRVLCGIALTTMIILVLFTPTPGSAQVLLEGGGPPPPGLLQFQPGGPEFEAQRREAEAASPRTASKDPGQQETKLGCNIWEDGFGCVLYWVLDTVSDFLIGPILTYVVVLFESAVNLALHPIQNITFVQTGFRITLGIANMFFVLILLWIAIATIFDFEPYTARQLLFKLIIAALLINFSLAIGSAFVNLSNGIARIFYDRLQQPLAAAELQRAGPGQQLVAQILPLAPIASRVMLASQFAVLKDTRPKEPATPAQLRDQITRDCWTELSPIPGYGTLKCLGSILDAGQRWAFGIPQRDDKILTTAMTAVLFKLVITPILIFVLLAGAVFLIIRTLSLAFILVLGPLAFLFMILPATQRFYTDWWERLFKWSFFFPAFMFFVFLSLTAGQSFAEIFISQSAPYDRLPAFMQYILIAGLLMGSLMVANELSIRGAGTVTGWGKSMGKGIGKYIGARGWKYAGKAAEVVAKIPGVGRIAPLRAGVTAVMKKGAAVEKKDIDFYTKLPDRQLAAALSTMSGARARALWEALPAQRRRTAKPELAELARGRKWPGAPSEGPQPLSAEQIQTLQDQTAQIVRSMPIFQNLPQNIQQAVIQGMQQAVQNLPAGVSHQAVTQTITQTAQGIATQQARGNVSAENMARSFAAELASAPRQTEIQNVTQAVIPPPPRVPRLTREEELREEFETFRDELRGEVGELRERRT